MNYLADVYIVNAEALANELHAGTLSEFRAIKHFVVAAIVGGFVFYYPIGIEYAGSQIGIFGNLLESLLFFMIFGVISYFGIWLCFQANSKGDGKDFFLRMSVLTLPVMIRVWIVAILAGVPVLIFSTYIFASFLEDSIAGALRIVEASLSILFEIAFFIVLRNYLTLAARGVGENVT